MMAARNDAREMTVGEPTGEPGSQPEPAALDILERGELTIIGRIPSASNATLVCDSILGDGSELRCVYKPVRGEVPLWDFPDGTLAGREVASHLVSDALGWGVIPETVIRDGPLGPGMVQRWVDTTDNVDPSHRPTGVSGIGGGVELPEPRVDLVDLCPEGIIPAGYRAVLRAFDSLGEPVVLVHADDPRLQRMAVLDAVLNNADRKGGHVLEGVDGNVYGIDHGICLHGEDKLRTVLWGWAGEPIPAHLVADVAALADRLESAGGALRECLRAHLTDDEIDALTLRCLTLTESATMPRPPGHRPIPWPPF